MGEGSESREQLGPSGRLAGTANCTIRDSRVAEKRSLMFKTGGTASASGIWKARPSGKSPLAWTSESIPFCSASGSSLQLITPYGANHKLDVEKWTRSSKDWDCTWK